MQTEILNKTLQLLRSVEHSLFNSIQRHFQLIEDSYDLRKPYFFQTFQHIADIYESVDDIGFEIESNFIKSDAEVIKRYCRVLFQNFQVCFENVHNEYIKKENIEAPYTSDILILFARVQYLQWVNYGKAKNLESKASEEIIEDFENDVKERFTQPGQLAIYYLAILVEVADKVMKKYREYATDLVEEEKSINNNLVNASAKKEKRSKKKKPENLKEALLLENDPRYTKLIDYLQDDYSFIDCPFVKKANEKLLWQTSNKYLSALCRACIKANLISGNYSSTDLQTIFCNTFNTQCTETYFKPNSLRTIDDKYLDPFHNILPELR